jgi:NADPH:quinone reductase-like Zn-dependent oxidoreductase
MLPVFIRPYTVFEITSDPERFRRAKAFVSSGLATGTLVPVIDRVFDLYDIVEAHRRMEDRGQLGKIVVTVGHGAADPAV